MEYTVFFSNPVKLVKNPHDIENWHRRVGRASDSSGRYVNKTGYKLLCELRRKGQLTAEVARSIAERNLRSAWD